MSSLLAVGAISACATATEDPDVGPGDSTDSANLGSTTSSSGGMGGAATFTSNVMSVTVTGPGSNTDSTGVNSSSTGTTGDTSSSTSAGGTGLFNTTGDTTGGAGSGGAGGGTTTDQGTGGDTSTTDTNTMGGSTLGSMGGSTSTMSSTTGGSTTGGDTGTCTAPMVDGVYNTPFNLETTDALCVRYSEELNGWTVSNFDGRAFTVNGESIAVGAALPAKLSGYYFFDVSAGAFAWASITTW
jgi:hypothetical protein